MSRDEIRHEGSHLVAFRNHRAVMLAIDPETGRIEDANLAAQQFYGYPIATLRTMSITDIIVHDTAADDESTTDVEHWNAPMFRHRLSNGAIRTVEVYSSPVMIDGRSVEFSIIHDITAIKQVEFALRDSEERHRQLYNNTPVMLHSIDRNGVLISVSDYWLATLGYSREEVIGRKSTEFLTEDSRRYATEVILPEFMRTGVCTNVEYRFVRKNGEVLDTLLSAISERDEDGTAVRSLAVVVDVTDRKDALEKLRESEERFRTVFAEGAVPMAILGGDLRFIHANAAFTDLLGYDEEELKVLSFLDVTHGRDVKETRENLDRIISGAIAHYQTEKRFVTKHGTTLCGMVRVNILHDSNGNFAACFVMIIDITGRRSAEQELRVSQEMYRDLIESSRDLVYQCDAEGRYVFLNQAFETTFGYTIDEMLGRKFTDFQKPDMAERDLKVHADLMNWGEVRNHETVHVGKDGREIHLVFNSRFVVDNEGRVTGTRGTAYDVTERKKGEAEVRRTNEQLKKINAEKDRLFATIAHDLRSPFSSFLGFTDIMADESEEMTIDELRHYARALRKSALSVYGLLENLLEWSRLQRGMYVLDLQPLNVAAVLGRCVANMREVAQHKEIALVTHVDGDIMIRADENLVDSILRNLVSNAIKFTHRHGCVTLAAGVMEDGRVRIDVRDTGIGMSAETLAKLFRLDIHYRTKGTEGERSSGLGLLLCREFVDMHHGNIEVHSEPGAGSVFSVLLPGGEKN